MRFSNSYFIVSLLVFGSLFLVGCPATTEDESGDFSSDITIAVITHGGVGDSFWDVVKNGAERAGEDLGINVIYQSDGDAPGQAQLIDSAISTNVDGLAVSMANPQALEQSVKNAVNAGIPVVTINSGLDQYKAYGAMTHVGQTEYVAGVGAGERLASEGVSTLLCIIHEQGNIGLEERCDGAEEILGQIERLYVSGTSDVATSQSEIQAKLQATPGIDGALTLNPVIALATRDAIAGAGVNVTLGTFDLNGDVVDAIQAGEISFAIDQQQYLQGYLPVVLLYLNVINANTTGGGLPVLTGPGFVDKGNAATVSELASQGTR